MPLILGTNSIKDTGYTVANSCMFDNINSDAYMHITYGSASNQKTWTFSAWIKRANLSAQQTLFSVGTSSIAFAMLYFNTSSNIVFYEAIGGPTNAYIETDAIYRDPGAWMHVLLSIDTTLSTANNRQRLWVNGTEVTSFTHRTNFDLNDDGKINDGVKHYLGGTSTGLSNLEWDGYMSEVVFLDGTAVTGATDFGEFDEDSPTIWKPIDVSGLTFGTNGFYLDFEDSSNLGNNAGSGAADLTEVNLAATDQMTDSPTNNFATLNPLKAFGTNGLSTITFSEGNLKALGTDDFDTTVGTIGVQNGVWYYEVEFDTTGGGYQAGWTTTKEMQSVTTTDLYEKYVGFRDNIKVMNWNSEELADYGAISAGDILGLELDLDSGTRTLKTYHNGTLKNTATLPSDKGDTWIPLIGDGSTSDPVIIANFGNPIVALSSAVTDPNGYGSFEYSTGSGYALCTKNLAEFGG